MFVAVLVSYIGSTDLFNWTPWMMGLHGYSESIGTESTDFKQFQRCVRMFANLNVPVQIKLLNLESKAGVNHRPK